jgi:hypothetical protein
MSDKALRGHGLLHLHHVDYCRIRSSGKMPFPERQKGDTLIQSENGKFRLSKKSGVHWRVVAEGAAFDLTAILYSRVRSPVQFFFEVKIRDSLIPKSTAHRL